MTSRQPPARPALGSSGCAGRHRARGRAGGGVLAGVVALARHALPALCGAAVVFALLGAPPAAPSSAGHAPPCPGTPVCDHDPVGLDGVDDATAPRAAEGRSGAADQISAAGSTVETLRLRYGGAGGATTGTS